MCVVSLLAFILVLIAFLACGVGFLAPYWVYFPGGFRRSFADLVPLPGLADVENVGLLSKCYSDKRCQFFWEQNFEMERDLEDWHKAAQALYSFGFVILLSTVLLALLHVCCRCCCKKALSLATVIGSLITAGFVLIAAAIGVFGAYQHSTNNVQLMDENGRRFQWAFFVAIGGVGAAILASILFICDGCRARRSPEGYESARMI